MRETLTDSQRELQRKTFTFLNPESSFNGNATVSQNIHSFFVMAKTIVSKVEEIEGDKRKLILVVDDEPLTFELIEEFLKAANFNVEILTASSGNKAYSIAISVVPDLIITDWLMPEIDGLELIKQLKASPVTCDIPILMMTGVMAPTEEFDKVIRSGAMDYLRKPLDYVEVKAYVKAALALGNSLKEVSLETSLRNRNFENDLEKLRTQLNFRQRELAVCLELLIHSRNIKEKLVEEVNKLQPYLSVDGKSKLNSIRKQLQWELNQESGISIEKKFDEVNTELYTILERICPDITKNEKRLCAYLRMNHGASDIAKITDRSLNSVHVGFARLRAKLKLPKTKDLRMYLYELSQSAS